MTVCQFSSSPSGRGCETAETRAARRPWEIEDGLWERIEPLPPAVERRYRRPGRKRLENRRVLCGILFVLYTGIRWEFLPQGPGFGSGMTCWRRWSRPPSRCRTGSATRASAGKSATTFTKRSSPSASPSSADAGWAPAHFGSARNEAVWQAEQGRLQRPMGRCAQSPWLRTGFLRCHPLC
jgi:transposase